MSENKGEGLAPLAATPTLQAMESTKKSEWQRIYSCEDACGYYTHSVYVHCCPRCGSDIECASGRFEWRPHRVQWWRPATWDGGRWVFTGEVRR